MGHNTNTPLTKLFMKTHIVQLTKNINYNIRKSDNMFTFKIQGIRRDLSMMRLNYNLMKRTTNTEKIEKLSKIYNIKTLRLFAINWLLRVTSIIQSSITSLWDLSTIYGYLKKNKQAKAAISKKNWARKVLKPLKNVFFFSKKSSIFTKFCNSKEIFIINLTPKNQQNTNKYIKNHQFSRKPVVSKPLISITLNGS